MIARPLDLLPGRWRPLPEVCPFPPPYRSMLALSPDVEWTSWDVQLALYEELAKRGLETSFSFWMFGSPKVTWRVLEEDGSPSVHARGACILGRAGLLDTVHSIGGRTHLGGCRYGREDIRGAYAYLAAEDWWPRVFTNHGGVDDRQNVAGAGWADYQEGDEPHSDLYHMDLTVGHGIRFFWCDPDYTSKFSSYAAAVDSDEALFVGDTGRDGTPFLRFRRWLGEGLPYGPSLDNLHVQLGGLLDHRTPEGYTVVYQHLGVEREASGRPARATVPPLRVDAGAALDRLAAAQNAGDVLVSTSARLLMHAALMAARPWTLGWRGRTLHVEFAGSMTLGDVVIDIGLDDLHGWAVELPAKCPVTATLDGRPFALDRFHHHGRSYAGLPWQRLEMNTAVAAARAAVAGEERG